MNSYIENVAFHMGHIFPSSNEGFKTNSIFQNVDQKYIKTIDDKDLLDEIKKILEKDVIGSTIDKLTVTFSIFSVCNLRVYCTTQEQIDPDEFSFDKNGSKYADIYTLIDTFLMKDKLLDHNESSKSFLDKVDSSYKYLYHQHLTVEPKNDPSNDPSKDPSKNPDVSWSIYKYDNNKISEESLDLDSLLLERHVLYYVYSRCYIDLMDTQKIDNLKTIQSLLNSNRKQLAEHELLLHELDTEHFEKFSTYLPIHRIDESEKTHDKLESNVEHLSEQLEDERRHKETTFMEIVFLFLALVGLVSIITGILALLPGKTQVCDTNTSDILLTPAYSIALGLTGNIIMGFALFAFVGGLVFTLQKIYQKYKG